MLRWALGESGLELVECDDSQDMAGSRGCLYIQETQPVNAK